MTWRAVVLVACCCLVALGVLLVDRGDEEEPLQTLRPEDVRELFVIVGAESSTAVRGDGGWRIVEPVEDTADSEAVATMLEVMGEATAERSFPLDAGRESYGLEPPLLRVIARGRGRELARLSLGRANPSGRSRYAQTGDDSTVHLVPDRVFVRMENAASRLRSRRLLSVRADAVDTLCRVGCGDTLTLVREGGGWAMERPVRTRADDAAVRALLRCLTEPLAKGFVCGGAPGEFLTWIVRSDSTSQTLRVCPHEGESLLVHASGRPCALAVDSSLAAELFAPVQRWRSREFFPVPAYEVASLELASHCDTLRLWRGDAGGWRVGELAADAHEVLRLLRSFEGARVDSFLDPGAWTGETELAVVVRSGEGSWTIEVGPPRMYGRLVVAPHLGGPAIVGGLDLDSLVLAPAHWRARRLVDVEEYRVEGVRVEMGQASARATRRGFDRWKRHKGWAPGAEPDTLLQMLYAARIVRFAEEGAPSEMEEQARITLTLDRGELMVSIGRGGEGEQCARVDGGPVVVIDRDVLASIERCLERTEPSRGLTG